jgi:hypothetical protein
MMGTKEKHEKNSSRSPPSKLKRKKQSRHFECMLSLLPIGCMHEISLSKTVSSPFFVLG